MLSVFHVDMGRMMTFDLNVASSRVQNLKEMIERSYGVPLANVVLLASGGEMLSDEQKIGKYSAGTDSNPIYMFSTVEDKTQPPWPSIEPHVNLAEQVECCISLPATYQTVVSRAQLAQKIYEICRDEETICKTLVHEQHLQQQGWSAVIANMEDLTHEFRERFSNFCLSFNRHLEKRPEFFQLLHNFNDDLLKLSNIPILPGLMQMAEEEFHGFDELLDNDEVFVESVQENTAMVVSDTAGASGGQQLSASELQDDGKRDTSPFKRLKMGTDDKINGSGGSGGQRRTLTLLQWISAKENRDSLRSMAEECTQSLKRFDHTEFDKLKENVMNVIKVAEKEEIKEIRGLSERLCGLENLKIKIRDLVKDQRELSTAFIQNKERAGKLNDASILPDLCASHRSQLLVMLNNQKQIADCRRRISKAKDELGDNLNKRLKYIIFIENSMSNFDSTLLFYHRVLLRAERHLNIINQIHQTPIIYVAAVTEVVRRKVFSGEFIQWASTLACDFDAIHTDEIERRRMFNANFEGHFLNSLFPGMGDMPPAFANENPLIFDAGLPNITKSDIDVLSSYLPDLTNQIQLPDMRTVIDFFISRSGNRMDEEKSSSTMGDKLQQQQSTMSAIQPQRPIDLHAHLRDGCESETDTEEFEKVGQSGGQEMAATSIATSTTENVRPTTSACTGTEPVEMHTVETLTEPPKKPPRISKSASGPQAPPEFETHSAASSPCKHTLPIILETESPPQNDPFQSGHHANAFQIESEFVNSEFYIDESLPSSCYDAEGHDGEDEEDCDYAADVQIPSRMFLTYPSDTKLISFDTKESLQTVFGLLQDNLGSTRLEVERLRAILRAMSQVSSETINLLRSSLQSLKRDYENERLEFRNEIQAMSSKWMAAQEGLQMRQHQIVEAARLETMQELGKMQDLLAMKDQELLSLREEHAVVVASQQERIALLEAKCAEMENQHKTEIESLRCRYKLMTRTDPPLDASAMADKASVVDMDLHESILKQARDDFSLEKEMAIKDAVDVERAKWDNIDLLKKSLEDKEKQVDELSEHAALLKKENYELMLRLQSLSGEDDGKLLEQNLLLRRANVRLDRELVSERMKRSEMESSYLKCSTTESTTSHVSSRTKSAAKTAILESCKTNDIVFVIWNIHHGQFMIVQDSSSLYFVHADSLSALGLRLPTDDRTKMPIPFYTVARVQHKEYCQARKDENRYKVSKGTQFYRIKLLPLFRSDRSQQRRERHESTSSNPSVSRSTSTQLIDSFAQTEIDVSELRRLLPPPPPTPLTPKDVTDGSVIAGGRHKERLMSVTSVSEEDDDNVSMRSRYISVSEEEETRTVITEQPTSNKMECANSSSTEITSDTSPTNSGLHLNLNVSTCSSLTISSSATAPTLTPTAIATVAIDTNPNATANTDTTNLMTVDNSSICSLEKEPEDSDEYRSLETI